MPIFVWKSPAAHDLYHAFELQITPFTSLPFCDVRLDGSQPKPDSTLTCGMSRTAFIRYVFKCPLRTLQLRLFISFVVGYDRQIQRSAKASGSSRFSFPFSRLAIARIYPPASFVFATNLSITAFACRMPAPVCSRYAFMAAMRCRGSDARSIT